MAFHQKLRQGVLSFVLLAGVFLVAISYAQGPGHLPASSSESPQIGKVLSVRKVLRNPYFFSRYPRIHYYLLYFAVRASDQTYCSEYETPVLDEIDDLFSAKHAVKSLELRNTFPIFTGKSKSFRSSTHTQLLLTTLGHYDRG